MTISVSRTKSARDYHTQQEHYLYRRVNFNDPQITAASKVIVGVLPADAYPLETIVRINTTFDNGLIVGTSGDTDSFVDATAVVEATTGVYHSELCASLAYSTVDRTVYAQTSTAATIGQADIWVRYLPTR